MFSFVFERLLLQTVTFCLVGFTFRDKDLLCNTHWPRMLKLRLVLGAVLLSQLLES